MAPSKWDEKRDDFGNLFWELPSGRRLGLLAEIGGGGCASVCWRDSITGYCFHHTDLEKAKAKVEEWEAATPNDMELTELHAD